jgi:hypothetical protein
MATYRKLPSGKFQAIVRLQGMKPLYATFPTKTKAKQWAKIVEEDTSIACGWRIVAQAATGN